MKVIVIEDEKPAADRLLSMLEQTGEKIEVTAVLDSIESAVFFFNTQPQPDIIFMDIELGDGKSFDIFKQVQLKSHIIFTTAFDEYAIQAFKYNSIDYLLKPLKKNDLDFAINKYKSNVISAPQHFEFTRLLEKINVVQNHKTRFLVKRGSRLLSIEVEKVAYAFTRDRIHHLKTFDGEEFLVDNNLDELESLLNPTDFFRANRQFILSYKSVEKIFPWFDGKLKIQTNPSAFEDIMVSRLKANAFKNWLGK
jgi:DNA-binding LytR/AlgR family response regulator